MTKDEAQRRRWTSYEAANIGVIERSKIRRGDPRRKNFLDMVRSGAVSYRSG